MNNQYSTLAEAIEDLKKRGFNQNLRVSQHGRLEGDGQNSIAPSEVKLVEFHRFEGVSDPSDSSIVYAVETSSGIKGTVVDSFGADGTEVVSEFMNKVEQHQFDK